MRSVTWSGQLGLTLRLLGAPAVAESAEKKHGDHDDQDEQPD
jgi:hypothetical protein